MKEKLYETPLGTIHYWTNEVPEAVTGSETQTAPAPGTQPAPSSAALVFLPGLTADHRLFEKQVEYFEDKCRILVWDAPEHAASWPFKPDFDLRDKARWVDEICQKEGIEAPIIVGQSMGGYVGQMYAQLFPEKLKGFVSIDSAPLQRKYVTAAEIWLLKRMGPVYRHYPWKSLLKAGVNGVATSAYGRQLMHEIMMTYDGDQARYAQISGHGYRMLAEAMEADLPYEIKCPALLICGEKDRAGSCIRYNREWHRQTGIPIHWIKGAGHNSNTDEPDVVNALIGELLEACL